MRKVFTGIFIATALLMAQGTLKVTTLADITGNSTTVQLQTSGSARWVLFVAPSTNSAVIRIGDSATGATRGAPVAAGGGLLFPPVAADSRESATQHLYNLANIYYYVTTSDKVSIQWGN